LTAYTVLSTVVIDNNLCFFSHLLFSREGRVGSSNLLDSQSISWFSATSAVWFQHLQDTKSILKMLE